MTIRFCSICIRLKFSKSGFEVNTAQNSTDALKKSKKVYAPDIMILDVIMPGMDGIQLLRQIRTGKLAPKCDDYHAHQPKRYSDIEKAKKLGMSTAIS
jgi:CheY-like chemotaxis protein